MVWWKETVGRSGDGHILDYFLKVDWMWERTQGQCHGFELENWKDEVVINRDGKDDQKK